MKPQEFIDKWLGWANNKEEINDEILNDLDVMNKALTIPAVISSVCNIHKGTRCEKSFPSYTDGKCRECGGQAN